MQHNSVALRYAQALFTVAKQTSTLDKQLADLMKVQAILESSPDLSRALLSPTVSVQVKHQILRSLLATRIEPVTLNFLYVMVDKGRENIFNQVLESYRNLLRAERGELEVTVRVAVLLDPAVTSQVKSTLDKYTKYNVSLKIEVDPQLLGGMVIIIGDRMIDGSLKTQLMQIGERLTGVGSAAVGG
jgi:F-type H+-transporting ATPase subunit delta